MNGMKGPTRSAPAPPGFQNRYSPVTNWNDDPFGPDIFEPKNSKKVPPPRPPPPKLQPKVPAKPMSFMRKPTVLTSLLTKKKPQMKEVQNPNYEFDPKVFRKTEVKNVRTASLIDLSSPPSSPTFTTRSSSDGLSVDSFGSDATSSNQHFNCGNASQAESGFEDDFDLVFTKKLCREDTFDDFSNVDPFSPVPKKPAQCQMPTIIRASKPCRPKPPDNSSLLKSTFNGSNASGFSMNVNMGKPIERAIINTSDLYSHLPTQTYQTPVQVRQPTTRRESSPPMPTVPPPPPPPHIDEDELPEPALVWPDDDEEEEDTDESAEPCAVALYDYHGDMSEDLSFKANTRIKLLKRLDPEWLEGCIEDGSRGMFPANYVDIINPLPGEQRIPALGRARALYDLPATYPGDLPLRAGAEVLILERLTDDWCIGESLGSKGQFPINYVEIIS